jgi:hypothetical protein
MRIEPGRRDYTSNSSYSENVFQEKKNIGHGSNLMLEKLEKKGL